MSINVKESSFGLMKFVMGIFIVRTIKFKCSVDQAKRCFYRAANSIFARVGRLASEPPRKSWCNC